MSVSKPIENNEQVWVVNFPHGLVGLEEYHRFVVEKLPDQEQFWLLRSLDDKNFGLVLTNPFWFKADYEFELPDMCLKQLGDKRDMRVFVTVTLAAAPQDITVNLLGPIVLNPATSIGFQILVADKGYTTKHKLMSSDPVGG